MEQNTKITMLVIPADSYTPIQVKKLHSGLNTLQALVGGDIEGLPSRFDWIAYGNAEAKLIGLPFNLRAHLFLVQFAGHNPSDKICGDVVITGIDDEGYDIDVPDSILAIFPKALQQYNLIS